MNTRDLAKVVADQHGLSTTDAQKVVAGVLDGIVEAVARGDEVSLAGFGKFKRQERAAREGRNPSTGESIQIAASSGVVFTPAKALKDRL